MQCVVITGAAGELGSAVARRLVADGYRAALVGSARSEAALRALAVELGGAARSYAADVGDGAAWSALVPAIERDLGAPTHAALVAGGFRAAGPLHRAGDDAVYRTMLGQNLDTVVASLRALLPGMVARRCGSVVAVASRAAERPWTSAGAAEYGASKAAVVALVQAVAAEVLDSGVRINAVLPSMLDTAPNRQAMPDADTSKWVSTASAAGVIAFLLSDAARDVSAALVPIYGRA